MFKEFTGFYKIGWKKSLMAVMKENGDPKYGERLRFLNLSKNRLGKI